MRSRPLVALPVVLAIGLAAPASAQTPGLIEGVSKIRHNGIGKVRTGMTIKQAKEAAGTHMTQSKVGECTYLDNGPPGTGQGPTLRFHNGRLRHIHVARKGFATQRGVEVGDKVKEVRAKYKGLSSRDNLGGGKDLVWRGPKGGRLIFSHFNGKVHAITGGKVPWVNQQECV
jgi:hypothetical protein